MRLRMRFLNLIKYDNGIRLASDGFGQLTSIIIAHISRWRTYQSTDSMSFHEFRHVKLDQGFFTAEQETRQGLG